MSEGSVEGGPGAEEREANPFRRRSKNVLRADGPASAITWSHRKLAWTCRAIALALGLVQAWAFRYEANPDGVSYLDVADAYREGRWEDAPNGYWSPLYSWLLALGGIALRLPPSADFVLAHVINFVAFVAALVAFEYFLRGVAAVGDPGVEGNPGRMHDWWILGYALFVWAGIGLIGLGKITPDILLAAAAFSVAGVLIRIRLAPTQWRHAVLLGLFAGVGYLTKLAFLPLTGVLLGVALVLWGRNRRTVPMVLLCIACLALLALPYAVALSRAKGRFTFGDTGRIAYAWLVNGVHSEVHWQGGPPSAGAPLHPTRQLSALPTAYEFATPLRATYPPWYDPSYWYEGVRVQPAPLVQARIAFGYLPRIFELHAALILIAVATIVALRVRGRALAGAMRRGWFLIVPGMTAVVMYSTVLLDTRYVAPFVVMVWVGVLLTLEPFIPTNYRRGLWVGAATVLTIAALSNLAPRLRALLPGRRDAQGDYATFVLQSGVRPGDELALIGDGQYAYWARLARVHLVAEVPSRAADDFWTSGKDRRRELLDAFRRAGAVAVVAPNAPPGLDSLGWLRSPDGKLAVLPLGLGIPD